MMVSFKCRPCRWNILSVFGFQRGIPAAVMVRETPWDQPDPTCHDHTRSHMAPQCRPHLCLLDLKTFSGCMQGCSNSAHRHRWHMRLWKSWWIFVRRHIWCLRACPHSSNGAWNASGASPQQDLTWPMAICHCADKKITKIKRLQWNAQQEPTWPLAICHCAGDIL